MRDLFRGWRPMPSQNNAKGTAMPKKITEEKKDADNLEELHDIGQKILEAVIDIAPYGSQNMMNKIRRNLDSHTAASSEEEENKETDLLNAMGVSKKQYDDILSHQEAHLRELRDKGIHDGADVLYRQEAVRGDGPKLQAHFERQYCPTGRAQALSHAIVAYKWAYSAKMGRCIMLSRTAFVAACLQKINQKVTIASCKNFDHAFLIIGPFNPPKYGYTALADVPKTCLIIDPWIRCKFSPQDAHIYWEQLSKSMDDAITAAGPPTEGATYQCSSMLSITPQLRGLMELPELIENYMESNDEACGYSKILRS
jgi:hypothetical protein